DDVEASVFEHVRKCLGIIELGVDERIAAANVCSQVRERSGAADVASECFEPERKFRHFDGARVDVDAEDARAKDLAAVLWREWPSVVPVSPGGEVPQRTEQEGARP